MPILEPIIGSFFIISAAGRANYSETAAPIGPKIFVDTLPVALKNVAKKNPAKSGSESGFFRKNPDSGNGLPDPAQYVSVLSTYARHLVHPSKNPDPAVGLPENRLNRLH